MIDSFANARVVVMGLGRFGGGAGVTRWLAGQGADVLLTDQLPADQLTDSLAELSHLIDSGAVALRLGEHRADDFRAADVVIANPAIPKPWHDRFLRAAHEAGVPVTTEIRLLTERVDRHRVIGVTGSAGKSTTSAMIHHILRTRGIPSHLGGNIGGSLLNALDEIKQPDWIVLELSSAMLYWLGAGVGCDGAPGWSPHVALLTNIQPNHVDWHGTFEHYHDSKQNIFRYRSAEDHRIVEETTRSMAEIRLAIPGAHNQCNAAFAVAAVESAIGIDRAEAATALSSFAGLPHRLELVHQSGGVRFYDDSKSTTPRAAVLAVEAFDDPARVHLIAGGYDKKIDLTAIAELGSKLAGLYTIGTVGESLAHAAGVHGSKYVLHAETLDVAVPAACERLKPGDVLLLSPGCASWDQFDNYEQRGKVFTTLVRSGARTGAARNALPAGRG